MAATVDEFKCDVYDAVAAEALKYLDAVGSGKSGKEYFPFALWGRQQITIADSTVLSADEKQDYINKRLAYGILR